MKDILGDRAHFIDKLLASHDSFTEVEVMVDSINGLIHCLASGKPILERPGCHYRWLNTCSPN
ncbi:MAG TPA: hypothetical protein GXX19_00780 [Syntrophomonadaceae bacterium]|nr:hypothetical protein [Syntrophomonadaceae bacterium]